MNPYQQMLERLDKAATLMGLQPSDYGVRVKAEYVFIKMLTAMKLKRWPLG